MKKIDVKGDIITDEEKWIYNYLEWPSTCPKDITDALQDAEGDSVEVTINSCGGNVIAGSEIYTMLMNYDGEVNINVIYAASAASVISMAGKSKISPTGLFMIHNVSCSSSGDYRDMDHTSDVLKAANKAVASAYRDKTGMTEKELLKMMDNETWLSADEAVEKGFIDEKMFSKKEPIVMYNSVSTHMINRDKLQKLKDKLQNEPKEKKEPENKEKDILLAQLEILKLKGETL